MDEARKGVNLQFTTTYVYTQTLLTKPYARGVTVQSLVRGLFLNLISFEKNK